VQFETLAERNAAALRAVNDAIANEEVGENDIETIEEDEGEGDDDADGSEASDGSGSESEEVAKKGATIHSIVLTQRVVRRLLTTLAHDLFMRRWISAADLFSTTFTNLHGLKEARQSYSCIEQIFRDYDDDDQSRWKEALKTARESLSQQDVKRIAKLNDTATGGFAVVNARSIAVHERLRRFAEYHSPRFFGKRECPICGFNLTNRPIPDEHTCFTQCKTRIKKGSGEDDTQAPAQQPSKKKK
jgi:hypothetical protein